MITSCASTVHDRVCRTSAGDFAGFSRRQVERKCRATRLLKDRPRLDFPTGAIFCCLCPPLNMEVIGSGIHPSGVPKAAVFVVLCPPHNWGKSALNPPWGGGLFAAMYGMHARRPSRARLTHLEPKNPSLQYLQVVVCQPKTGFQL